ncbi:MAG: chromate efflux transporter [Chloroflexi bacterium]|nr:chromate efflux transporter [Chloroflexota bacterium]
MNSAEKTVTYLDLARLFLRLSLVAFGGPVAHIAMVEDEVVARRQWLTRAHFLDMVAATNLIPGPNSTEVMIHIGYIKKGIPGAVLAGVCFIGPAFLLTLALAVLYVQSGALPQINALLWGIKPVIVAIIANVGLRFAQTALKGRALWLLCVGCLALLLLDMSEVLVMLGAGLLYAFYTQHWPSLLAVFALSPLLQHAAQTAERVGLWEIFFYFLRIGSVLFGSGYLLVAYIQQDLVNSFGWLSAQQVLDAVAIGQMTPGPVLTTVTVVGYIVAGFPGALVGTIGVFLPAFVLVIVTAPLLPKMRTSKFWGAFLAGVNTGVVAAIALTLIDLTQAALRTPSGVTFSPLAAVMAVLSLALLLRWKINTTWLILGSALVGLFLFFVGYS